jgi:hypothetical protein
MCTKNKTKINVLKKKAIRSEGRRAGGNTKLTLTYGD